ncbi:MAG: CPBP family intramembrane glutamic endopeptidase [Gemmatimonadota bacterium]
MHPTSRWRAVLPVLGPLGAFFLWNVATWGVIFALVTAGQTWVGLAAAALLFAAFLRGYLLRAGRPGERRRWATLRLRPLDRDAALGTLMAVPVLFALAWSLGEVWTRLVPVPPETFRPFEALTRTAEGRLAVVLVAMVAAPIVEEFVFRGLVQRPLERRWGPAPAIAFTALLFALVHALPWVLPIHLLLGLAFGFVVYATRSVWAGVLLHAANNSLAALGIGAEAPELPPTVWRTGFTADFWTALAMLVLAALAARALGLRMLRAGHGRRAASRPG